MILACIMAAVAASGDTSVIWLNACEIKKSGVTIERDADYTVWLRGKDDATLQAEVAGQNLEAKPGQRQKQKYIWGNAGSVKLKEGKAAVKLGEGVAGIVLSTSDDLNPNEAQYNINATDSPEGVRDSRATNVKHTDTMFTMPKFQSKEEWETLADRLRKRFLLGCGLWPMPEKTPLNVRIFDRVERDGYTIEKVYFESRPGLFVGGNLYRPLGKTGPFPGVVNPHGHWKHGRLEESELGSIPARSITLAKMGIVSFTHDMVGYNDSCQFEKHGWSNNEEKIWGIHPFAFQLWNDIRCVDFLLTLPDVNPERIACTGASGGGTQTFALTAIDPRICVSAPVNMISSTMQGGCICENAPLIRFENSNMEVGALMAPRPMLMVSATGDWTRATRKVEYPAVQSIYKLYGAESKVENVHVNADHNYNRDSREAVYRFFGKWLLGDTRNWAEFKEPEYKVENPDDLLVFPGKKLPEGALTQAEITANIIKDTRAKWDAIMPKSPADIPAFKSAHGEVLALTLGITKPEFNDIQPEGCGFEEMEGYVVERWVLRRAADGSAVPCILYHAPYPAAQPQEAVLLVHGKGKAALADVAAGKPGPIVRALMDKGYAVMTMDAYLLGDHHSAFGPMEQKVVGQFADTFHPTTTAQRVQDIVTALAFLRGSSDITGSPRLAGFGDAGLWCVFAAAVDGGVSTTLADINEKNVDDDALWCGEYYIPSIRSIGDLRTAAALVAPAKLVLANPASTDDLAKQLSFAGESVKVISSIPKAEEIVDILR